MVDLIAASEEAPGRVLAALVARILLTAAYWSSGIAKVLDFPGAVAEQAHFGLPWPHLTTVLTIAVQLLGALSVICLIRPALGAVVLAAFTLAATLLAHAFWTYPVAERPRQLATFMEHLGLIGGFLLVALSTVRRPSLHPIRGKGDAE